MTATLDTFKTHQVEENRLAAALLMKQKHALQADLDIMAGKVRYQQRRDDAAVRAQQERLGQIGEMK